MTIIYTRTEDKPMQESEIKTMIDNAFNNTVTEVTTQTEQTQAPASQLETYKDPESYRKATGKRFRMTKEEIGRGLSREAAFEERAKAGKLEV